MKISRFSWGVFFAVLFMVFAIGCNRNEEKTPELAYSLTVEPAATPEVSELVTVDLEVVSISTENTASEIEEVTEESTNSTAARIEALQSGPAGCERPFGVEGRYVNRTGTQFFDVQTLTFTQWFLFANEKPAQYLGEENGCGHVIQLYATGAKQGWWMVADSMFPSGIEAGDLLLSDWTHTSTSLGNLYKVVQAEDGLVYCSKVYPDYQELSNSPACQN